MSYHPLLGMTSTKAFGPFTMMQPVLTGRKTNHNCQLILHRVALTLGVGG